MRVVFSEELRQTTTADVIGKNALLIGVSKPMFIEFVLCGLYITAACLAIRFVPFFRETFGGVDDTLTVNGTVALCASGTVTITADPFRPDAGEYTLLHTSGLTLEDGLGGWSVVSELRAPAKAALKRRGDDLLLVVTRPGTSILFR